MTSKTFTAGAAIATLLVTTAPITATTATAAPIYEQQVFALTNNERVAAGCPALTSSAQLDAAARRHTLEMARTGNFSHTGVDGSTPAQRVTDAGYPYRMVAENIAAGQTTADEVVRAWMNSSGHRANIVNCELRDLGIGYAVDGNNKPYWTQDFGTTG
ncbi:CAP domain-containing protein [Saccharothrix sp. NRRL B-16314]|uniref:CAP domain-containing protein n=1 Tax=Saccharothrix sp. NRRL B-16314 TaxID=1463825 RepID=UPI00068DE29C|nr:CAP domain-containing protein [Saccharothrix sp. NRRL B-16314]